MGIVQVMVRIATILVASIFLFSANVNAADQGDLTGKWIGTWTSLNSPTYNGVIEMSITQKDNTVSGSSVVGNTKCFPDRVFKGELSGKYNNFIKFKTAPMNKPKTTIAKNWGVITRNRNAISSVYNFNTKNSRCYGDVGTMFISKVQPYSVIKGVSKK